MREVAFNFTKNHEKTISPPQISSSGLAQKDHIFESIAAPIVQDLLQITWTVDGDLKDPSSLNKRFNSLQVGSYYHCLNNWTNVSLWLTSRSPTPPGLAIAIVRPQIRREIGIVNTASNQRTFLQGDPSPSQLSWMKILFPSKFKQKLNLQCYEGMMLWWYFVMVRLLLI